MAVSWFYILNALYNMHWKWNALNK